MRGKWRDFKKISNVICFIFYKIGPSVKNTEEPIFMPLKSDCFVRRNDI